MTRLSWEKDPIHDKETEDWAQNHFHGILSKGELQLMKNQLARMIALEVDRPGWWTNDYKDCMPAWRYASIICRKEKDLSFGDFKVMKAIEKWVKEELPKVATRHGKS